MAEHDAEISSIIAAWEEENAVELDDEQFDRLSHQIAEQAAANDGHYNIDQLVGDQDAEWDEDEWDDAAEQADDDLQQREFDRLESKLGRRLTQREVEAVAEGMVDQVQRTGEVDGQLALNESYEQKGEAAPNLDNREDRRKWMQERIQDERAANAPDDSERVFNLDDKADRVAYMTERFTKGTEFEAAPDEAA